MVRTQVIAMLKMNDATLKSYLQKECKHKEEILRCISNMRDEAHTNNEQLLFDKLSWLYRAVKGIDVLCP
jgi:hypothetical protein